MLCYFSLRCFDFATFPLLMDPNLLRECAQRLVKTADFIRNVGNCTAVTTVVYLPTFFWVKCVRFSSHFRKCSGDFQIFPTISWRLTNATENVRRYSDDFWTLPTLLEAFPMAPQRIETRHFSAFWYSLDSNSTLSAVYWNNFGGIELNFCC